MLKISNKNPKDKLQNEENIPIENKFTRDYRKDSADLKIKNLEEQRKKIKYRDEKRSEIQEYWNMNNKLINKTFYNNKPPRDPKESKVNNESININNNLNTITTRKSHRNSSSNISNLNKKDISDKIEGNGLDNMKISQTKFNEGNTIISSRVENDKIFRSKSSTGAIKRPFKFK